MPAKFELVMRWLYLGSIVCCRLMWQLCYYVCNIQYLQRSVTVIKLATQAHIVCFFGLQKGSLYTFHSGDWVETRGTLVSYVPAALCLILIKVLFEELLKIHSAQRESNVAPTKIHIPNNIKKKMYHCSKLTRMHTAITESIHESSHTDQTIQNREEYISSGKVEDKL